MKMSSAISMFWGLVFCVFSFIFAHHASFMDDFYLDGWYGAASLFTGCIGLTFLAVGVIRRCAWYWKYGT